MKTLIYIERYLKVAMIFYVPIIHKHAPKDLQDSLFNYGMMFFVIINLIGSACLHVVAIFKEKNTWNHLLGKVTRALNHRDDPVYTNEGILELMGQIELHTLKYEYIYDLLIAKFFGLSTWHYTHFFRELDRIIYMRQHTKEKEEE